MPSSRTAAQILAEWHARNNTCPPGVECEHHGPMATDEPDCAACWLAAAEKRAKASEEMTYDEQVQVIAFVRGSHGLLLGGNEGGDGAEAMVPRAALEWAVHKIDGCVYHDGRECAVVESGEENEDCFDGICFEHRMQAALKAAEEGSE